MDGPQCGKCASGAPRLTWLAAAVLCCCTLLMAGITAHAQQPVQALPPLAGTPADGSQRLSAIERLPLQTTPPLLAERLPALNVQMPRGQWLPNAAESAEQSLPVIGLRFLGESPAPPAGVPQVGAGISSLFSTNVPRATALPATLMTPARPFLLTASQEPVGGQPQPPSVLPDSQNAANGQAEKKDANGQPQKYGREPESTALQFLREQSVLLKAGAWQFDTGLAYTLFDNDFPVAVVNGGGTVTGVTEAHLRRRILYSPFALRYGITDYLQAFAYLPIGWSNSQFSTVGTTLGQNVGGQGDLNAGLSMHLLDACGDKPDVIGTVGFTAPTGQYSTPLFQVVPGSNLGQGFWALQGNMLFVHRYDPVIVFYGAGYRHLFQREFAGVPFQAGEQVNYQFGVGFSVNDRVTLSTALQGFYISNSVISGTALQGTNIEPISLRFAATISRRCRILEPFAVIGMTDFAPAAWFGMTVTFY